MSSSKPLRALLAGECKPDNAPRQRHTGPGAGECPIPIPFAHEFTELNPGPNDLFNAHVTERFQAAADDGCTRLDLRAHWLIPAFPNNDAGLYLFDIQDNLPKATLTVMYRP